jgi:hypothetical protein
MDERERLQGLFSERRAPFKVWRPFPERRSRVTAGVFVYFCLCLLLLPSPCIPADWLRIDLFPEDESVLPNIFLDFDTFKAGNSITAISARLVNPDSSYAELMVKMKCATDEFDMPMSKFYDREGTLVSSEPVAEPQWSNVPRGSHIEFIKFFLCAGARSRSVTEFNRMRGFRDVVIMSRLADKEEASEPGRR